MLQTSLAIIISFGKIGLISLGGGNSMLKLLEYEAVTYRHWIGQEEFVNMVGSTFLFPGLTGVKLAALIGYKAGGLLGLLLAIFCLNMPGLLLALLGYHWLSTQQGPYVRKLMIAVQYGALALLAAATFSVAEDIVSLYYSLPIALACLFFFLAMAFGQFSPFLGLIVFVVVSFLLVR